MSKKAREGLYNIVCPKANVLGKMHSQQAEGPSFTAKHETIQRSFPMRILCTGFLPFLHCQSCLSLDPCFPLCNLILGKRTVKVKIGDLHEHNHYWQFTIMKDLVYCLLSIHQDFLLAIIVVVNSDIISFKNSTVLQRSKL